MGGANIHSRTRARGARAVVCWGGVPTASDRKMGFVENNMAIPSVIGGVDVSAVGAWFTSNGGERGMDVEISAAAESSEQFLSLFMLVAMHWAPLGKIAKLKEMVEFSSLGIRARVHVL